MDYLAQKIKTPTNIKLTSATFAPCHDGTVPPPAWEDQSLAGLLV